MKLDISIRDVQHIKKIDHSFNLSEKSIICITGKNGSGKTTLIKSIKNLISADTFLNTMPTCSLSTNSKIYYKIDGKSINFEFDKSKKTIDSRDLIPNNLRNQISIELPIPYGDRFGFFNKISSVDSQLRAAIVSGNYIIPYELIEFLNSIYATTRFESLREIRIKKTSYYAIPLDNNYYLREDHLSSGEYFIVSIYRRIISGHSALFIDEIDISLDASAQVRLIEWLRNFKEKYNITFVFTTHSLAMMRMLNPNELFYMEEQNDGSTTIEKRSYGFIKSTLFGFKGWDKYILTEDDVLKDFIEHLISKYCRQSFYQHKIIYVGGGTNTTDLMKRNETEKFFSQNPENVISILDGDQRGRAHSNNANVYCIPMESIEKDLLARCLAHEFLDFEKLKSIIKDYQRLINFIEKQTNSTNKNIWVALWIRIKLFFNKNPELRRDLKVAQGEQVKEKDLKNAGKRLFKELIRSKEYTRHDIFEFLIEKNKKEIERLQRDIENFICIDP